jgi:hypothetical protein
MTLEILIKQKVIPLSANVLVVVLFSHSLITRTPFRLEFSRWNIILRYRTATYALVVIEQTSDFFFHLISPMRDELAFPRLVSVICVWTIGVLLLYASLYRYERYAPKSKDRLMTVLRGSREYAILQALRASAIVLALINIYLFIHITVYRYSFNIFGIEDSTRGLPGGLYYANMVLGMSAMLYFAVVDLTSSVLMASS